MRNLLNIICKQVYTFLFYVNKSRIANILNIF